MSIDWFGLKARAARKAEKERLKKEIKDAEKEDKRNRLIKIKEEFQILKKRAEADSDKINETNKWWDSKTNDKCPKCGSKHVNERIKRLQGEFSGYIEGSMDGGFLRGSSGYISGQSHGSIDTNEVNKCNDCQHEWKKAKSDYTYWKARLELKFNSLNWLLQSYHDAFHAKLDSNKLEETFVDDQEKRTAKILEVDSSDRLKDLQTFFQGISIETIQETALKEIWPSYWSTKETSREYDRFMEHFKDKYLCAKMGLTHLK